MPKDYNEGDHVKWKWGNGYGQGKVAKRYTQRTTLTIKGSEITRDASSEEPAYRIEQDDGDQVLKSHSELDEA